MMGLKETTSKKDHNDRYVREFSSLSSFGVYLNDSPTNSSFAYKQSLSSSAGTKQFTGTSTYAEALGLYNNGWDSMAKQLVKKVDASKQTMDNQEVKRMMFDVVGFQASVPRYLQGLPTSMINKKTVSLKKKVITLNKDVSYSAFVTTEQIIEASKQTLLLIRKIEAQGVRVNLNLIWGAKSGGSVEVVKIRLKSAGERLNISKLAFPLVHPSMLRRLLFRYLEVAPTVNSSYVYGYGMPLDGDELRDYTVGEYLLPRLFTGNINSLGNLVNICNLADNIKVTEDFKTQSPKVK